MSWSRDVGRLSLAAVALSTFLWLGSTAPASACGYFTGYDDCGHSQSTKPAIRFQPAPEEPWVWPDEGALAPYVWSPYTKRDKRQFAVPPTPKSKKTKPVSLGCPKKGSLNPACW